MCGHPFLRLLRPSSGEAKYEKIDVYVRGSGERLSKLEAPEVRPIDREELCLETDEETLPDEFFLELSCIGC